MVIDEKVGTNRRDERESRRVDATADELRPTYRVSTWDCDAQDFTMDGQEFAGLTKWGLRGALRELYDRGWDHVSMLVEREDA